MKTLVSLSLVIFMLLSGCSIPQYKNFNDEYKKTRRSSYSFEIKPNEKRSGIELANISFLREKSDKFDVVKVYWVMERSTANFPRDTNAYAKAMFKIFPLEICSTTTDFREKQVSKYSSTTDTLMKVTSQDVKIEDKMWYEDKFIATLQPELVSAIKSTGELNFRFYYGAKEVTFSIKGEKLTKIKSILLE